MHLVTHTVFMSYPEFITKWHPTGRQEYFSSFIYLLACIWIWYFVEPLRSGLAHTKEGSKQNGNPCRWGAWSLLDYWAHPYQGRHSCLHIGNDLALISDVFSLVYYSTPLTGNTLLLLTTSHIFLDPRVISRKQLNASLKMLLFMLRCKEIKCSLRRTAGISHTLVGASPYAHTYTLFLGMNAFVTLILTVSCRY